MQQAFADDGFSHEAKGNFSGRLWLTLLTGLIFASAGILGWKVTSSEPFEVVGLTIDRLSALLALFVAAVGAVTVRFSLRYLDGDPNQIRFVRILGSTVVVAYVLMLASNLIVLFACWALVSLGLHGLLTHYATRKEALRPARKKFLFSRLGDLALLSAILLIWNGWGTLNLGEFLSRVATGYDSTSTAIALFISIAALTKSAQFPFHSWLPETMESPTPVSALMHAGIINAGGVLILKFAPLIVRVPEALLLLSVIGTLTMTLGMVAMWAQVKVKRVLAWSTVSQMGFMMIQCGLAAFPAAAIHIIGHGCYKAWSFLQSSGLPRTSSRAEPASLLRTLTLLTAGIIMGSLVVPIASEITGFSPWHSPGEWTLSAVVVLTTGQLWVALLGSRSSSLARLLGTGIGALAVSGILPIIAFGLYRAAGAYLSPVFGEITISHGPLQWIAAVIPLGAIVLLTLFHAFLPAIGRSQAGRQLYVHALHGFYFGVVADQIVDRISSRFLAIAKGVKGAKVA